MSELVNSVAFSQLSMPKTWFEVANDILPLLEAPEKSGFRTATDLLIALAKARNLTPRALIKQIEAARFLLNTYPALIAECRVTGGHSQVEYLAKIHKLAVPTADNIARDVIVGHITVPDITERYIKLRDQQETKDQSPAVQARLKALRDTEICHELVRKHFSLFGANSPEEIAINFRFNKISFDAAVVQDQQLKGVIEFINDNGFVSQKRNTFLIISKIALYRFQVDTVWLFMLNWNGNLVQAIQDQAQAWGITGIKLVFFEEAGSAQCLEAVDVL